MEESILFTADKTHDALSAATEDNIAFLAGVLSFSVQATFCSIFPWCDTLPKLHELSDVGLIQQLEQTVAARLSGTTG
jgi:hypothetical protein